MRRHWDAGFAPFRTFEPYVRTQCAARENRMFLRALVQRFQECSRPGLPSCWNRPRIFGMRAFRTLALILIGVGLFVQGAAHASAQPAPAARVASDCGEMTASEQAPAEDDGGTDCCADMQLGCLVGMNCIAPLFPPSGPTDGLNAQLSARKYSLAAVAPLGAFAPGPEPPPPQSRS